MGEAGPPRVGTCCPQVSDPLSWAQGSEAAGHNAWSAGRTWSSVVVAAARGPRGQA